MLALDSTQIENAKYKQMCQFNYNVTSLLQVKERLRNH